jgi:hypothetical protein
MYQETEREVGPHVLSNLGLNPHAAKLLVESYIQHVAPMPAEIVYDIPISSKSKTSSEEVEIDKVQVEIHMVTPGYVGRAQDKQAKAQILDSMALKLLTMSYLSAVRPKPISFLHYGVEVHIKTPGVPDALYRNIARTIFNAAKKG